MKGAKDTRAAQELAADLMEGVDPEVMKMAPAEGQALAALSAEVKTLGLPAEAVQDEVADAVKKVGADYEVLLPYLQKRLKVLQMEAKRQAAYEKKMGQSLDSDISAPVGSTAALFE